MRENNKILRNDIEYSVHCEENGVVIGPIAKTYAHLDGARSVLCHYSTWSMIYNPLIGKYGIQLKNPKKHDKYNAGKWDMGVAGHNPYVKYKNDYKYLDFEENLIKEAKEEIGIKLKITKNLKEFIKSVKKVDKVVLGYIFDRFHYKTKINNEYVGLGFILTTSEKVKFTDSEVIDFKWLTPNELRKFLKENKNYCDPLPLVFNKAEKFRKKYL